MSNKRSKDLDALVARPSSMVADNLYHLSFNRDLPEVLGPRLPDGWEDGNGEFTTPRVSFSTSILGAVRAIWPNIDHVWRGSPDGWLTLHVYLGQLNTQRVLWTEDLVKDRLVFDAHMTDEVCVLDPIEVQYVQTIRIRPKGRPVSFREYGDPRGKRYSVFPERIDLETVSIERR